MQQGVIRRSPFYDLPYFSMSMVQYDLMHTATGVLTTFNKGYTTAGNPLFLTKTQREQVSPHVHRMAQSLASHPITD
jgi:hypothetical protein